MSDIEYFVVLLVAIIRFDCISDNIHFKMKKLNTVIP